MGITLICGGLLNKLDEILLLELIEASDVGGRTRQSGDDYLKMKIFNG